MFFFDKAGVDHGVNVFEVTGRCPFQFGECLTVEIVVVKINLSKGVDIFGSISPAGELRNEEVGKVDEAGFLKSEFVGWKKGDWVGESLLFIFYFQMGLRMGWLDWVALRAVRTSLVKGESGGATFLRRSRVWVASLYLPRLAWA